MKKLFVFAVVCAMLFSLINASFAAGYLSGNIMSDPLAAGKMDFSQRIDSSIASETLDMGGSAPKWAPIDAHYSFTNLVLPMMFAFGLTDNISFRTTIPYVSTNMTNPYGGTLNGTGLGDIRSEVLFGLLKESAVVPSIAVNLGIKFPTGKFRDLAHITGIDFGGTDYYWYPELPTGTGGTDYSLSFILGKKLGPVNGKALLGYTAMSKIIDGGIMELEAPYFPPPDISVVPAGQLIFSLAGTFSLNNSFEIGGELWGNACGPEKLIVAGVGEGEVDYSERTQIYLSPYLTYMLGPGSSIKGVVDIPLSVTAGMQYSDIKSMFKGMTVSVGASISL